MISEKHKVLHTCLLNNHIHTYTNATKIIFKHLLIVYIFESGLKKIPIQDKSGPLAIVPSNMQKAVNHWLFKFFLQIALN